MNPQQTDSYFLVWRGMFNTSDPLWQAALKRDGGLDPVLAWLDLIAQAAYVDDATKRVGFDIVTLRRGEILVSARFLTARWGWGGESGEATGRVVRFLAQMAKLERIAMVRKTKHGTVYRIVKYETYQAPKGKRRSTTDGTGDSTDNANGENVLPLFPAQPAAQPAKGDALPKGKVAYPAEFDAWWAEYPKRDGGNSKKAAYRLWLKLTKKGVPAGDLLKAVKSYAVECQRLGKVGTDKVLMAQTFLGPDARWEEYVEKSGDATSTAEEGSWLAGALDFARKAAAGA